MNFHRPWTIFALDAEHDAYGMARIAQAHNTCMSEYENAKRELAAARALLREANPLLLPSGDDLSLRIDDALAEGKK